MIKTLSELRAQFWEQHPAYKRKTVSKMSRNGKPFYKYADQSDYPADVRTAWVFFIDAMQNGARAVLNAGGCTTLAGQQALARLDRQMLTLNASPGGAADLLAATLFLDRVETPYSKH